MGKKAKDRSARDRTPVSDIDVPSVGLREPCPCGSGRRYKACHGRSAPAASPGRAFEGFVSECDLVALRELVPAATAPLTLRGESADAGRSVTVVTVLPMAWPALVRDDGAILLGLQVTSGGSDVSRELGSALVRALSAEPGTTVAHERDVASAPRLQDLVVTDEPLQVSVHQDFGFWLATTDLSDGGWSADVTASMERANAFAHPTERLTGVTAAYWTRVGDKEHVRWVMPEPEEELLDALARLHAAQESSLGDGTRLVGMFRSQGLLAPVWDLPWGFGAQACESPASALYSRLQDALADDTPLTSPQRQARAGLTTRQVTLR